MRSSHALFSALGLLISLTLSAEAVALPVGACPGGASYPVALTLDDGPNASLTPIVLDTLKTLRVPATFFVVGELVDPPAKHPVEMSILHRIRAEGHSIGSHTYRHIHHMKLGRRLMRDNLERTGKLIPELLSPILRLPFGDGADREIDPARRAKSAVILREIESLGYRHVSWEIDANDWDPNTFKDVLPGLLKQICDRRGGVILLHDRVANTVGHLQEWIEAIQAAGHRFVPLEHFEPEAALPLVEPISCRRENEGMAKLKRQIEEIRECLAP